jgi:hypothetical protein
MAGMGNQMPVDSGKGLVLDGLEPRIPRPIQLEGAGFYVHRRVSIAARDRNRVHAVVRGGRPYDVTITLLDSGKALATCDCVPFQQAPAVCRHMWAALIKIQNDGLLTLPAAAAAR